MEYRRTSFMYELGMLGIYSIMCIVCVFLIWEPHSSEAILFLFAVGYGLLFTFPISAILIWLHKKYWNNKYQLEPYYGLVPLVLFELSSIVLFGHIAFFGVFDAVEQEVERWWSLSSLMAVGLTYGGSLFYKLIWRRIKSVD